MRCCALAIPLLPSAALTVQAADFDSSPYQFRKFVDVPGGNQTAVIPLDRETLAKARADLADIRLASGTQEQPYVLSQASGRTENVTVPAKLVNRGYVILLGVQGVLEVAGSGPHNRLQLETTEKNFRSTVLVETSDDRKTWAQVGSGEIFDFTTPDRHAASLTVDYPVSTQRYLRLTITAWEKPAALAGASVSMYKTTPAVRTEIQLFTLGGTKDSATKSMLYLLDFGVPNLPVDQLEFDFGPGYFQRPMDVEVSPDQKEWRNLMRSVVTRLPGEETVVVSFRSPVERYLRVRLYHGDDSPMEVRRITATCVERRLTIQPMAGREQRWLYYGRPDATAPQYDLAAVLARLPEQTPARASLGPQQANPSYERSDGGLPWSEGHPWIVYGVLGLVVLGLGIFAVRLIRETQKTQG